MRSLTPKQAAFVEAIAEGATLADAYRRAYSSKGNRKTALQNGHNLSRTASVAPFFEAAKQRYAQSLARSTERSAEARAVRNEALLSELDLSRERVLRALVRIAFSDLSQIASWDAEGTVTFKASDALDDAAGSVCEITSGTRAGGGIRLKQHDKLAALTTLARMMGLFAPDPAKETGQSLTITLVPPDLGREAE